MSTTQTRKNNTGDESKIKSILSVSAKAGLNLNTLSMTPSLELKNTKEVSVQQSRTKTAASFGLQEKQDVAKTLSTLPKEAFMEQECVTVCLLQSVSQFSLEFQIEER